MNSTTPRYDQPSYDPNVRHGSVEPAMTVDDILPSVVREIVDKKGYLISDDAIERNGNLMKELVGRVVSSTNDPEIAAILLRGAANVVASHSTEYQQNKLPKVWW